MRHESECVMQCERKRVPESGAHTFWQEAGPNTCITLGLLNQNLDPCI